MVEGDLTGEYRAKLDERQIPEAVAQAINASPEDIAITLDLPERTVRKVLEIIAETSESLRWKIEDGVVKSAEVEAPGKFEVSTAEACMMKLQ